jgi:hypothetical protein
MAVRRLAVALMIACLTGSLLGAEGEAPPPLEAPAGVGPAGAAPVSPIPQMTPTTPPPPSAMPPTTGTSPEVSGQGTPEGRPRLRGRLRARLKGLLHGGN